MKITCTEEEKAELIYELAVYSVENDTCLFTETNDGKCIGRVNCRKCIEDNVGWEIKESKRNEKGIKKESRRNEHGH